MSINGLYHTARRSLLAYQASTNTTGQNLANAETPGYTRRTVALRADPAIRGGVVFHSTAGAGGGVGVQSLDRVRSAILDSAVRRGRAGSDGAGESAFLLSTLETQLAPDGGEALLGALSGFYGAWSDIANAPTDGAARDALLASASHLIGTLQGADARLRSFPESVEADLEATVDQVNGLLSEIAALNESARTARSQGADDLDALDRRDLLLDQLSGLVPTTVRPQDDGTVTVSFGGMVGVQGAEPQPLRLVLPPAAPTAQVFTAGAARPLQLGGTEGGVLGAQLHMLETVVPAARASLDALVARIVGDVNALHTTGTGLDGGTGRAFFDPAGITVASFALSADLTGPDAIAAGTSGPGDGSVATALAGLGRSAGSAATSLLAKLGTDVRTASAAATANAAFAAHAEALRDGVSKVSIDEEMTNLLRFQQGYAASARVLETAQALFDTLLTI